MIVACAHRSIPSALKRCISLVQPQSVLYRDISYKLKSFNPASDFGITYDYELYLVQPECREEMALTFISPTRPGYVLSDENIIGWLERRALPSNPAPGNPTDMAPIINPKMFKPNPMFEAKLHKVIADNIHKDETVQALANYQKEGHMNINDERIFTPWGRVSNPEDILGVILVEKGIVQLGSYQSALSSKRKASGSQSATIAFIQPTSI
ncbi:hypothetical protein BSLG_008438 [Batrachochytrium salamandrivorans]|nr:hypothetical protein BSLG_008438 [Batrachochytrium salamandrivorans]